jgi:hypothetical protein
VERTLAHRDWTQETAIFRGKGLQLLLLLLSRKTGLWRHFTPPRGWLLLQSCCLLLSVQTWGRFCNAPTSSYDRLTVNN